MLAGLLLAAAAGEKGVKASVTSTRMEKARARRRRMGLKAGIFFITESSLNTGRRGSVI